MKEINTNFPAMNSFNLVREFFPNATDEECSHILWEYTGFPEFFDPKIGAEAYFRAQLEEYALGKNTDQE